jgi:hypothetical protein
MSRCDCVGPGLGLMSVVVGQPAVTLVPLELLEVASVA